MEDTRFVQNLGGPSVETERGPKSRNTEVAQELSHSGTVADDIGTEGLDGAGDDGQRQARARSSQQVRPIFGERLGPSDSPVGSDEPGPVSMRAFPFRCPPYMCSVTEESAVERSKGEKRKKMEKLLRSTLLTVVLFSSAFFPSVSEANAADDQGLESSSSPFDVALANLQGQIGYTFKDIGLLRRAMTHPSFSQENNRALSILGSNIIDASVSFHVLAKNIEISPKELNRRIVEISSVESSCAVDGTRLGLQKVIRVSTKTDPTNPSVICAALRAIFGAIAVDSNKCDSAADFFWKVHGGGQAGAALAL